MATFIPCPQCRQHGWWHDFWKIWRRQPHCTLCHDLRTVDRDRISNAGYRLNARNECPGCRDIDRQGALARH